MASKPRASIKPRRGGFSVRVGNSFTFCQTRERAKEAAKWMQARERGEPYHGPVETVPLVAAISSKLNSWKLH
jgi:hypothetical protein